MPSWLSELSRSLCDGATVSFTIALTGCSEPCLSELCIAIGPRVWASRRLCDLRSRMLRLRRYAEKHED